MSRGEILLFGTTWVDTLEKRAVQNMWFDMAKRNHKCEALIVDCNSPMLPLVPSHVMYYTHEDNIGHLSRGGRDGWGRAFCHGLDHAVRHGYRWAVHVECDSICKLDIVQEAERLDLAEHPVATIPLSSWAGHIETGLMFFSVEWLRDKRFTERYDWMRRVRYPEPEKVVKYLCDEDLHLQGWRGMRDDFHELTEDNVRERRLDWLTHADLRVMEAFVA